jgi:hypothetical protein
MENLAYKNRDQRNDKWRQLRTDSEKGICRYSTHVTEEKINPITGEITQVHPILWVVAWSTPKPVTVGEEK